MVRRYKRRTRAGKNNPAFIVSRLTGYKIATGQRSRGTTAGKITGKPGGGKSINKPF